MNKELTVALDAMGGDDAPSIVIEGAKIARERYPQAHFIFFGRESDIKPLLDAEPDLKRVSSLVHTDEVVSGEDKPGHALRRGRKSSMGLAIEAVKSGKADVAVSAGNTGALMALAKFTLRTLPNIDRPALASLLPTYKGECVMLDLGANVECEASNLVEFAIMGAAFARSVLGLQKPRLSLLNIGVEELKGNEAVKDAADVLRKANLPIRFDGFVEGDMIATGVSDVVVTDGFTGNVALKTAEGTAKLMAQLLADAFQSSLRSKLGYSLARRGLRSLRDHLDPNNHDGAVMLGLNGLVVKSHGGANAVGFATAIGVAVDMISHNLVHLITEDLGRVTIDHANGECAAADPSDTSSKRAESK